MRIIELLAFFRELLASELRAIVDALPSALHDFRIALQSTVDQCFSFFMDDAPAVRYRRVHKRKRLSRMNAKRHLLGANGKTSFAKKVGARDAATSLEMKRGQPHGNAAMPELLQADAAYPHDRVATLEEVESDNEYDQRGANMQAFTNDNDDFLEEVATPVPVDDAVAAAPAKENVSFEDIADKASSTDPAYEPVGEDGQSIDLLDWNDTIPRVPGVARKLPVVWTADMMANSYAALDSDSDHSSDTFSICDTDSVGSEVLWVPTAPGSGPFIFAAFTPTETLEADQSESAGDTYPVTTALEDNTAILTEQAVHLSVEQDASTVASPQLHAKSKSKYFDLKMLSTGTSYRQLTQELAPSAEGSGSPFYHAALRKLKQERKIRVYLRAQGQTTASEETQSLPRPPAGLPPLRPMQMTPLMPANLEDKAHCTRAVDKLRKRSTTFAIKIGQPIGTSIASVRGPQAA